MIQLANVRIDEASAMLRDAGAIGVDAFELKLRHNANNPAQLENHLSEFRAAMMFIQRGYLVTMRDSPDLMIDWLGGERFYAEVKHFRRKRQDEIDEVAMRHASGMLAGPLAQTQTLEGKTPWEQICDVARRKKRQYIASAINILVIDSASESLELMATSGANEYSDQLLRTPTDVELRRLHGIMIINVWGSVAGGFCNVDFGLTTVGLNEMSLDLAAALEQIRLG